MFASKTDAELCQAAGRGQQEAFTELVRRYQGAVCAVTFAVTGRRDLSEDAAQETFLIAWRKIQGVQAPDRIGGWLTGIARNVARKSFRQRPTQALDPAVEAVKDTAMQIEDAAVAHETRNRIWAALSELPIRYREAMILHYREELPAPRVSQMLGISVAAAEQRLSRGRRMIREGIEREVQRELARSRPTEAFSRRVAAALPAAGLAAPTAASTTASTTNLFSGLTKLMAMHKTLSAIIAVAAVLGVGVALRASRADSTDATLRAPTAPAATRGPAPRTTAWKPVRDTEVSGVVVDAQTREPIPHATIALMTPQGALAQIQAHGESGRLAVARADEHGAWSLEGLRPGRYVATATARAYLPGQRAAFEVGEHDEVTDLSIELAKGGLPVSGTVMDLGGGPIEGATVRAKGRLGRLPVATLTDADGRYQLQLPEGTHTLTVWDPSYQEDTQWLNVHGQGSGVDFQLVPGASIRGRVIERVSGDPVAGAVVSFRRRVQFGAGSFSSESASEDEMVVTAADGTFSLQRLSPAEYELFATADHLATTAPEEIAVGIADQTAGVVLPVDPAFNVYGRVVAADDPSRGLEGAEINAFTADGVAKVRSDEQGHFVLRGVRPGKYPLFVEGEALITSTMEVTAEVVDQDVTELEVPIESGVAVQGRLSPPREADVRLALMASSGGFEVMLQGQRIRSARGPAEASGEFRLDRVPPGKWRIIAEGRDGSRGESVIEVGEDGLSGVKIDMKDRPSVTGRVVDTVKGPVSQVTVRLVPEVGASGDPTAATRARGMAATTTTDDTGGFVFMGVEPGTYRVQVEGREGLRLGSSPDDPGTALTVEGSSIDGLEVTIERPTGVIAGKVVDTEGQPVPDASMVLGSDDENFRFDQPPVALADSEGLFRFEQLGRGTYRLYARSSRGDALGELDDVDVDGTVDVEVVLTPLSTIRGVVTAGGAPVRQFEISVAGKSERTFVADDGRFELTRLDGTRPAVVVVETEQGTATHRVELRPGQVADVSFEIGGWARVTGRAIRPDGSAAAGLRVWVNSQGGMRNDSHMLDELTGDGVVTDAEGRFTVAGIGSGRASVALREPVESAVGPGFMIGRSSIRGLSHFFIEPGDEVDLGDIVVSDRDPVPEDAQGNLGLRVEVAFDRPARFDEEGYTPPVGRPTGAAKLWIDFVDKTGPAADAGLTAGMQIIAIDGEPVQDPARAAVDLDPIEKGRTYRFEVVGPDGGTSRTVALRG